MAYTLHNPWIFKEGKATLSVNTLTESYNLGIKNPLIPDIVHMSNGVYVHTWSIESTE